MPYTTQYGLINYILTLYVRLKDDNTMKEKTDLLEICAQLGYTALETLSPEKYSADEISIARFRYTQLLIILAISFMIESSKADEIPHFQKLVATYYPEPIPLNIISLALYIVAHKEIISDDSTPALRVGDYTGSSIAHAILPNMDSISIESTCSTISVLWDYIQQLN